MLWNGAFSWLCKTDCCSVLLLCHYNVCLFQLSRRGVDPVQTQVWEGSPAHGRFPCRPQDGVLPSPAGRPSKHALP